MTMMNIRPLIHRYFVGVILMLGFTINGLAQGPGLFVDLCRFQDTQTGDPMVQIYTAVAGQTITFEEVGENRYQCRVHVRMVLERITEEDTVQIDGDSFNLVLPQERLLPDTTMEARQNANLFYQHQLRLEPGRYRLVVFAVDSFASKPVMVTAINEFWMERLAPNEFAFSDVKWVAGQMPRSGRTRSGRDDLIPMVTNSTFFNEDTLEFYQEIYNAASVFDERFLIRAVIFQGENRLYNYETQPEPRNIYSIPINAFKQAIYIGNLSSNIYHLQIELINERNRTVQTYRKKFYVYNSRRDADFEQSIAIRKSETDMFNSYRDQDLDMLIQTLMYKATTQEQNFMVALENPQQKRNFLYSFFERRLDMNPGQTVQSMWNGHLTTLKYVNQHFGAAGMQGWQTDRGRVWLTYGPPNDVERFPFESGLVPYEIWRYNRLESQTNVVFIFYESDRATGAYPLLHSTRYGELNNPRWQEQLRAGSGGRLPGNVDYERRPGSAIDSRLDIKD